MTTMMLPAVTIGATIVEIVLVMAAKMEVVVTIMLK